MGLKELKDHQLFATDGNYESHEAWYQYFMWVICQQIIYIVKSASNTSVNSSLDRPQIEGKKWCISFSSPLPIHLKSQSYCKNQYLIHYKI